MNIAENKAVFRPIPDKGGPVFMNIARREFLAMVSGLGALAAIASSAEAKGEKSRLILLGTAGGPTPKPNRAAAAQVIVVNGASYVIDCGNGVARQMVLAKLKLGSIRGVFLTHQHSDHNADYGNLLLLGWAADLATRVETYGPPPLSEMTRQFLAMNDRDIQVRIADEGRPVLEKLIAPHELTVGGVVMQDENVKVTAAVVEHPPVTPSFAYRFDCPDRSIVISGDTRPCDALVKLARGADVLVHEVMHLPSLDQLIATERNAKTLQRHYASTLSRATRRPNRSGASRPRPASRRSCFRISFPAATRSSKTRSGSTLSARTFPAISSSAAI